MFRSVLSALGAMEMLTVPSAPGLPYQKRYQTAWFGASVPENWPLLPVIVIALPALFATGPAVGVTCGVAGLAAEVGVGVAMVAVGVSAPAKLTGRSG